MRTGAVIALAIVLAVSAAGVGHADLMQAISGRYVAAAEEIRTLIEANEWLRAAETAGAYHQRWDETLRWLQMLVDHKEGDEVSQAMMEVEAGIRTRSMPLCQLGLSRMKEAAQHLYHRDAFTLGNVL